MVPGGVALPGNPGDTIQHGFAFSALTLAFRMAWPGVAWLAHLALMAVLGGAIELAQLVPALHRDSNIKDWLVDLAASLATLTGLGLGRVCRLILAGRLSSLLQAR